MPTKKERALMQKRLKKIREEAKARIAERAEQAVDSTVGGELARHLPKRMSLSSKLNHAYSHGDADAKKWAKGYYEAKIREIQEGSKAELQKARIAMINAVGQALDVQTRLLAHVGQFLDETKAG